MPRRPARPALDRPGFAAIAPGLEDALVDELQALGVDAEAAAGGAKFRADPRTLVNVHLWSRTAGRVTVELASTRATSLDDLARGIRGMPWRDYLHPEQAVDVKVTTRGTKLHYPATVSKKVENAIADALKGPRTMGARPPREPAVVLVHVEGDRARVAMDASGELLHRRGWRLATAKAPLRENLAAAVLRVAEWTPEEPLVDPMCGAGTFPIEAAGVALGHAPGYKRDFAFLNWPGVDRRLWDDAIAKAGGRGTDSRVPIVGADRDPGAVRASRDNARRAGVSGRIRIEEAPFASLEPPASSGLVVANPPYGARIGGDATSVFSHLGRVLRERWTGWRVALLVPDRRLLGALGLKLDVATTFSNGGIKVNVCVGSVG